MTKYKYLAFLPLFLYIHFITIVASDEHASFTYNGFKSANLTIDGVAELRSNGLLKLTSDTSKVSMGHAFYPNPITFKNSSTSSSLSFSTTFVFSIVSKFTPFAGHGLAFVIAPTKGLPGAFQTQYLGLFNFSNNGRSTNHVFAVEIDTFRNLEFGDINDHHVGIDLNGLESSIARPASDSQSRNMLISGHFLQVWVEYDGAEKQTNVSLAPLGTRKPNEPLISFYHDLSSIMLEKMYVGFSASSGAVSDSHYIAGWSFKMNGIAQDLDLSILPKLPKDHRIEKSKLFIIGLPSISIPLLVIVISCIVYHVRKWKFAEVLEDWEVDYGPHRFKFKDLYVATKGFSEKVLLGSGGFGKVYKGILPVSKTVIAVKRVSHESRQGMKEFVAEVVTIGRLRHRNLVPLLGYCRRKNELLLVYDYMPNGSLDKYLYGGKLPKFILGWSQRFVVIKGVASGLFYLHEEWEKVVVHRDVKASNVLLDSEFNGRLGDFGLARSYDHGADPQTTHVAGTFGYLAPECARKATTFSDVYAFGVFLLEVCCGRRPIEEEAPPEKVILVNWVFSCWKNGCILEPVDRNLGGDYLEGEVELVLKLGLLCSQAEPLSRPSMKQVVQYLESGGIPSFELSGLGISSSTKLAPRKGFDIEDPFSPTYSVVESFLSGPR